MPVAARLHARDISPRQGRIKPVNRKLFLSARLSVASLSAVLLALTVPASAVQTHTLKPGETLGSLARKYHVEVKELIAWNGIKNPENLRDGMKLLIPTTKIETKSVSTAKNHSISN